MTARWVATVGIDGLDAKVPLNIGIVFFVDDPLVAVSAIYSERFGLRINDSSDEVGTDKHPPVLPTSGV